MDDRKIASRYAKACRECAATKAKCIRRDTAPKCERCTRLNKDCKARAAATRAPRAPRANRITQMEQKLDGLVSLVAASQSQSQAKPSAVSDSYAFPTPNSMSPETRTCEFGPIQIPSPGVVHLKEKVKKSSDSDDLILEAPSNDSVMGFVMGLITPGRKSEDSSRGKDLPVLDLSDEVYSVLLENYQSSMAHFFPFVIIPSDTTASRLYSCKPFLFRVVMAVSSYQMTGQQTTSTTEIMRLLSEKMLFQGEKSLDLLQGLLVYCEWYHSHRLPDRQLTNLLQLSTALLFDVCLSKSPYPCEKQHTVTTSTKLLHDEWAVSRNRTNDERRAMLGCYYLTSIIALCFKKLVAVRYTFQMEDSCNKLSQTPEYNSDIYLVQLIKLHKINEEITQTLPSDGPPSFWASKPPISLLIKAFQTELQNFKDHLPVSLQQDSSMLLHIHTATTHLYEIALSSAAAAASPSHHTRIPLLHTLLLSTTSFLTHYLSLPPTTYSYHPFGTWAQTLYALQVLAKLSLLGDVPGWDVAHVRGVMDFGALLEDMAQRFEMAGASELPLTEGSSGGGGEQPQLQDRSGGCGGCGGQKGREKTTHARDADAAPAGSIREGEWEREWGIDGNGPSEKAESLIGPGGNRYELYAQRVRSIRGWFEGKAAALAATTTTTTSRREHEQHEEEMEKEEWGVDRGTQGDDANGDGVENGHGHGNEGLGGSGGGRLRDDFLTGSYAFNELDDAALWHDFLGEWGIFQD